MKKHVAKILNSEQILSSNDSIQCYNISHAIQAHASASACALFISLIYQIHHHLYHYIFFLRFALCNHQSESNQSVVCYAL